MIVANSALLADWFRGRELAFSFGIDLSVARLGSVFNDIVSPMLAGSSGVVFASWFGAILCGASVLCVLLTIPIDKHMDDKCKQDQDNAMCEALLKDVAADSERLSKSAKVNDLGSDDEPKAAESINLMDTFKLPFIFWVLVISCIVVYGKNVQASQLPLPVITSPSTSACYYLYL